MSPHVSNIESFLELDWLSQLFIKHVVDGISCGPLLGMLGRDDRGIGWADKVLRKLNQWLRDQWGTGKDGFV